jgi:hypothetical protein
LCCLVDSVLSGITLSLAFASLVTRSGGRISRRRRQIRGLVTNFPRGFAYLLPWVLLLPFIRLSKITDPLQRNVAYGLAWGSIIPFVIVLLTLGTLPRYILPLEAPFCWTVGSAVANGASQWSVKGIRVPQGLIFSFVAIGIVAGDDNLSAAVRDLFKEARVN